ncbi:NAD(P)H-dependent oxidoreductase [Flammeovirga aprica]|uniref:NAD(P)H-dependent oxidoreductase n=1 Tax=Flammeovirga aprica JL-4 TaxID=694437 RepID=A0A7X9XBR8_9BACT|nr:NAD(P)H-dependent oxidoreductase [Flammeovirga aprica]NME71036.1 NAD(P)H-dependent oxidoreductase [Flammeovirga aprica JL-4]
MNVLIIYAHPSQKSFTYQIFNRLLEGLKKAKHTIEISDLYQMNFQSNMSEEEYEREGLANTDLPIPDDVLKEHAKIEKADCIIFLYPLWWSDVPAILKGWFDRVYSVGYAYGYDKDGNKIQAMKQIPLGLSVCTAGHSNAYLHEIGIAQSMEKIMLDDRMGKKFTHKEFIILGGTTEIEKVKEQHLNRSYEMGLGLEEMLHQNGIKSKE